MVSPELVVEARRQMAESARSQALEIFRGQRAYAADSARGIARLNAGGIVAILVFASSVYARGTLGDPAAFVASIKLAAASLLVGLVAAACMPLFGYLNYSAVERTVNEYWQMETLVLDGAGEGRNGWSQSAAVYRLAGLAAFLVAIASFLFGSFSGLPALDALFVVPDARS